MITKFENIDEECNRVDHSLNLSREIKVDFTCFINKKETVLDKMKKKRKSEIINKTKNKQNNMMKDKDVDDEDDDCIPIKFVR